MNGGLQIATDREAKPYCAPFLTVASAGANRYRFVDLSPSREL